jgi:hypothetical protein
VNVFVVLMWLTAFGVVALFVALALFLRAINRELEQIGGPATRFFRPVNYLSKIRLGVRAIEVHTGHIAPQVTTLNAGLSAVRDGLRAIDGGLADAIAHVQRQERP